MQRVALVVVGDGSTELYGVGGVGFERVILNLDVERLASHKQRRLLLHLGRGVELLLLILELDILVEENLYLLVAEVGGVALGEDTQHHRRNGILGSTPGCAYGSTLHKYGQCHDSDDGCRSELLESCYNLCRSIHLALLFVVERVYHTPARSRL